MAHLWGGAIGCQASKSSRTTPGAGPFAGETRLRSIRTRLLPVFRPVATCRRQSENGMYALIQTILMALNIYWWIIIASAVFSWLYAFNVVNPRNQFVGTIGNALYRLTEPALRPIRRFMPDLGGIDISPIILLLIIFFLQQFIIYTVAPALLG
jgi:YggT family protein